MPEIWAECDVCDRRFYCERAVVHEGMTHHCPVCGVAAARITTTEVVGSSGDPGSPRRTR